MGRTILAGVALLLLSASLALASEASVALREAGARAKKLKRIRDPDERTKAEQELAAFCKQKSDALSAKALSKMDTAYLGRVQSMGGLHAEGVATLQKAVNDPRETKYAAIIHSYLIDALVAKGNLQMGLAELKKMQSMFAGKKQVKSMAMKVGLALRGDQSYASSAEALEICLAEGELGAVRPLVNSYLLSGQKGKATAAIQQGIDKSLIPAQQESYKLLLATTQKVGSKVELEFDAYTNGAPKLDGKVVVMGFWNISAQSAKWTFRVLENMHQRYSGSGVIALAVTTYYKKNELTGRIEADMTPCKERDQAEMFRSQEGYNGVLAFTAGDAGLKALGGGSVLPYFVVRGKDGTLLFAHMMNRRATADITILQSVIEKELTK